MKRILLILTFFVALSAQAQTSVYNPKANAKSDVAAAVKRAKQEGKHVLIQVGGNWCPWCIKLHAFFDENEAVNKTLHDSYIFVLVNYSKENKNKELLAQLGYPQRFGFPVLLVLDADGNRIHTQNSAYLEKDGGYSEKTINTFLKQWSPDALDPINYQ
ncbi:MAG: thioredoxin family protein [Mangrovibacterium sp.]